MPAGSGWVCEVKPIAAQHARDHTHKGEKGKVMNCVRFRAHVVLLTACRSVCDARDVCRAARVCARARLSRVSCYP